MQEIFGSVPRSLVFRTPRGDDGPNFGGLVEKIGSSIRKSRIGLFSKTPLQALPPAAKCDTPPIRWRKGELIGCGAFGRVYMGMNLDSGELLAVKQVSIAAHSASKERTQAHIRELEDEVKLLKNLSHPNIVRYLGTAREEESLNILLEFVPGGSISSLLGKFGSFPESVIRMYTKQLLLGLEYLHNNGIMHRDIKGANILVDNKGCIKLADFGASKRVVELATINGAKSMKGTPYWMAPEVILQTGHSLIMTDVFNLQRNSADIWSVGCTVIEMATGKPPWSQQYQEVAALFHIGKTKAHPPIPEHLTVEARDFLLRCLQKEPNLRSTASDLLEHPFVSREYQDSSPAFCTSNMESKCQMTTFRLNNMENSLIRSSFLGLKDVCQIGNISGSTICPEKNLTGCHWKSSNFDYDMCQIDDQDDLVIGLPTEHKSFASSDDLNKSFNPMSEPIDEWPSKFDGSPEVGKNSMNSSPIHIDDEVGATVNEFTFPYGPSVVHDDDEVTESKIRAFLDEKALVLKKLQTPLYKEFYSTLSGVDTAAVNGALQGENVAKKRNLPPNKLPSRRPSAVDPAISASDRSHTKHINNVQDRTLKEIQPSQIGELNELLLNEQQNSSLLIEQQNSSIQSSFSARQRKWKEELDEELARKREMMRQAGVSAKTSPNPQRFAAFPGR